MASLMFCFASGEKFSGFLQEEFELIVAQPVARIRNLDQVGIASPRGSSSGTGVQLSRPQKRSEGHLIWLKISAAPSILWP